MISRLLLQNQLPKTTFLFLVLAGAGLIRCSVDDDDLLSSVKRGGAPEESSIVNTRGSVGGILHYSLPGEPETFNPLAVYETRSALLVHLTSSTLLELDPFTQEIHPGVIADFTRSEDGTVFDLVLRKGLRFSDGTPVTSDDIVFTFKQIYREESNNSLKDSLLINGQPVQVEKLTQEAVRIRFPEVYAPAEYVLSSVPILPKHLLEGEVKPIEELWTLDTPPEKMAGLGPFMLLDYEPGIRARLSANPYYWKVDSSGTQLPYLDQVILEYVPDRNNQLLRFQANELDILDQLLRPEDFNLLSNQPGIIVRDLGPSNTVTFMWFNRSLEKSDKRIAAEWFGSAGFREAICSAIDRSAIVNNVYRGLATEAGSLMSTANPVWYSPDIRTCEYNPDQSQKLLQTAGFVKKSIGGREVLTDSKGREVRFELLTRADDVFGKIAAIIQQDLSKLGITLTIRQEEFRSVISRIMGSRDYESALMKLDIPTEPTALGAVLLSSGPMHMWNPGQREPATKWEADIDRWMSLQAATVVRGERQEIFHKIQQAMAEEVPLIPLVHRNTMAAWHDNLLNVRPAPIFPYTLWNVWAISYKTSQ